MSVRSECVWVVNYLATRYNGAGRRWREAVRLKRG